MRRLLATIAALSLSLSLSLSLAAKADPHRIVFIAGVSGNPFYTSVACGGAAAAKALGVTFETQAPQQFQPAMQLRVLDAVIASKPDGILFVATDPVALTPGLLEAKRQGIKILSIDGDIRDMDVAISNIQSDNVEGGAKAAQALAEALGNKGTVMAIMNTPAANVGQQRLDGFVKEIAKHSDMTFLGPQYSNNQTAKAASLVTSTIAAHPELAGVFTLSTNNTEGATSGVREAGRIGRVKVVGFDTSDPIVQAIRSGAVTADVVQDPFRVGQLGVQMMDDALNGKPVEREVHTSFVIATPANIDTPDVQHYVYKTHCS